MLRCSKDNLKIHCRVQNPTAVEGIANLRMIEMQEADNEPLIEKGKSHHKAGTAQVFQSGLHKCEISNPA